MVWVESNTIEPHSPSESATNWICFRTANGDDGVCYEEEPSAKELEAVSATLGPLFRDDQVIRESVDGFSVFEHANRLELSGYIDGLPVSIEASGIDLSTLMATVKTMTADSASGAVHVDAPHTLTIVHQVAPQARTFENVGWYSLRSDASLEVRIQPHFVPYAIAAVSTDDFGFTKVGNTIGIHSGIGRGHGSLTWEISDGIVARLDMPRATLEELIEAAKGISL